MAKFPLDLSKFVKAHEDDKTVTMRHPQGHEFRIAKHQISPELRKQLDKIQMAEGGEVPSKQKKDKSPAIDPQKAKEFSKGASESGWQPEKWAANLKQAVGYADGGSVLMDPAVQNASRMPAADDFSMPVEQPMPTAPPEPPPIELMSQPTSQQAPMMTPPQAGVQQQPSVDSTMPVQQQVPDMAHAYNQQLQAVQQMASAEQQLAHTESKILEARVLAQQKAQESYQEQFKMLENERKAHIEDINNSHVNPEKYWDNHSKLATGIGIIIAGFNPTGRPNAAIEFMNHQIDRSIEAQKANLGSKQNLLSANLHQFGNLKDATTMTSVMMADQAANQLRLAATKAADPMAKARAMKAAGDLEAQYAPAFQEMVQRQWIAKIQQPGSGSALGGNGQLSDVDPERLVNIGIKDPAQRTQALHEIKLAKDAQRIGGDVLDAFDKATIENTRLRRVGRVISGQSADPAALHGFLNGITPILRDNTGKISDTELHMIEKWSPLPGDLEHTIAEKRKNIVDFIESKKSAPTALANGIDLSRFKTTVNSNEGRAEHKQQESSSQQTAFIKWAQSNPNDPRAQTILKRLGK